MLIAVTLLEYLEKLRGCGKCQANKKRRIYFQKGTRKTRNSHVVG
jgi:hypothetical protein